jgi:hypothetical protein
MQDVFENIREQLHEIRNLVQPVDLKLSNLEHQFTQTRILLEERTASFESKLLANTYRVNEHASQISDIVEQNYQLSERMKRIELVLKISATGDEGKSLPVHEDKATPTDLPPQGPARSA